MQSENAITIVHAMASMCIMYKLYVRYLEHMVTIMLECNLELIFSLQTTA